MIQANELRIGNWVQRPEDIRNSIIDGDRIYFRVDHIMIRDCAFYKENWAFEPIPLDQSILEACGFEKKHNTGFWQFYVLPNGWYLGEWIADKQIAGFEKKGTFYYGDEYLPITSLHQLQNLYYSLTGQELAIDSTTIKK